METIISLLVKMQELFDKVRTSVDFIGPLLLRLYLVPVFWCASNNKWNPFNPESSLDNTIEWFGNMDWGLGLPLASLNAHLAWSAEYLGAVLLALGLATRWICIPLMVTMVVAVVTVHLDNGWQAVHDPLSPYASEHVQDAIERLSVARSVLKEHSDYSWLTEYGNFIISNNGIEWPATYFLMLLALLFLGGGKYVSVDHWLARRYRSGSGAL